MNTNHHAFRAMGCQIQVWIDHDDSLFARDCFERVETLFAEYEQCMTRFDSTSELSQLNRSERMHYAASCVPILMLTAMGEEIDRVLCGSADMQFTPRLSQLNLLLSLP